MSIKPMTVAEKIFAAHAGVAEAEPGALLEARVDLVLINDITGPIAIREFERLGVPQVFDRSKIVLVPDHFSPNKDIQSAEQCLALRRFAVAQGIEHYYEVGRMGIEHVLLPEQGLVAPGELVVGADSHTCTYGALGALATGVGSTDVAVAMATGSLWFKTPETLRAIFHGALPRWAGGKDLILYLIGQIGVDGARYQSIEFSGAAISALGMDGRFTIANMAIEAGAKAGLFLVDRRTEAYLSARLRRSYSAVTPDAGASYARTLEFDASSIEPQVSFPHLPSNTRPLSAVGQVPIDQVVIGSCTNGRRDDLRQAAQVLRGRQVHPRVRCIVIPGSQAVYLQAAREGLLELFVEAGAAVSTPTCGPCLGGYMGILAAGERCLSTTNRNFVGRMGHPQSEIYLANPAVAAASAVLGRIAGPGELGM